MAENIPGLPGQERKIHPGRIFKLIGEIEKLEILSRTKARLLVAIKYSRNLELIKIATKVFPLLTSHILFFDSIQFPFPERIYCVEPKIRPIWCDKMDFRSIK
jgi:hypothetical protein